MSSDYYHDLIGRLNVWRRSEFGQSPPGYMFETAANAIRDLTAQLAERDARIEKLIAAGDDVVEAAMSGTRHAISLRPRVEAWTEAKGEK